jgi:hypothetical protein
MPMVRCRFDADRLTLVDLKPQIGPRVNVGLTDETLLQFLTDGYLVIQPDSLDEAVHDHLYQRAHDLYEKARVLQSPTAHLDFLGDNLRAQIPRVDRVLEDPAVVGAIQSLIGQGYVLHPHHFVHKSGSADQGFHQDGNLPWNERGHYRAHRPDWLIMFYYPQAVDATNGPTEIIVGSQYWTRDIEIGRDDWERGDPIDEDFSNPVLSGDDLQARDERLQKAVNNFPVPDLERRYLHVPKGSVALVHYDLIHRGTRKLPDVPDRYMYKFYFARTERPRHVTGKKVNVNLTGVRPTLRSVIGNVQAWCQGAAVPGVDFTSDLADQLRSSREDERVDAAYRLAASGKQGIAVLSHGLCDELESVRRASAYGLREAGLPALDGIEQGYQQDLPSSRRFAVFALGDVVFADDDRAVNTLVNALADPDDLVRSNAAYSLGQLAMADRDLSHVVAPLLERLDPDVEPDNTSVAGLPRSTVRQNVGYALMELTLNQSLSAKQIGDLCDQAAIESDRYIAGMLVEAVSRTADVAPGLQKLLGALNARRFSPPPLPPEGFEGPNIGRA